MQSRLHKDKIKILECFKDKLKCDSECKVVILFNRISSKRLVTLDQVSVQEIATIHRSFPMSWWAVTVHPTKNQASLKCKQKSWELYQAILNDTLFLQTLQRHKCQKNLLRIWMQATIFYKLSYHLHSQNNNSVLFWT